MADPRKPSRILPWAPARATKEIWKLAKRDFEFNWAEHAREQILDRDLIIGDIIHVLKHGYVYEEAEPSARKGFFKYKVESRSPNSGGRTLRVVVVPQCKPPLFKVITVMWVDEPRQK